MSGSMSGWWQLRYFLCSPRKLGKIFTHFDVHTFQMGWFNHQEVYHPLTSGNQQLSKELSNNSNQVVPRMLFFWQQGGQKKNAPMLIQCSLLVNHQGHLHGVRSMLSHPIIGLLGRLFFCLTNITIRSKYKIVPHGWDPWDIFALYLHVFLRMIWFFPLANSTCKRNMPWTPLSER